MSNTYFCWTFEIDEARMPVDGNAVSALLGEMDAEGSALMSASRNDWHMQRLGDVLRASGADRLAFLDATRGQRTVDDAGSAWRHSRLLAVDVPGALDQLDRLLERAIDDPAYFVPFFARDGWNLDDIRAGREQPVTVDGDEGTGPAYFFDHMVGLRALLARAKAAEQGVAHIAFLVE